MLPSVSPRPSTKDTRRQRGRRRLGKPLNALGVVAATGPDLKLLQTPSREVRLPGTKRDPSGPPPHPGFCSAGAAPCPPGPGLASPATSHTGGRGQRPSLGGCLRGGSSGGRRQEKTESWGPPCSHLLRPPPWARGGGEQTKGLGRCSPGAKGDDRQEERVSPPPGPPPLPISSGNPGEG